MNDCLISISINHSTLSTFIRVFNEYCKLHPDDEFAADLKSKLIYTEVAAELETIVNDMLEVATGSPQEKPDSKVILN